MNSRFDRTVRNNNKKQQYNIGYIRRKNVGLAYYYNVHRGDKKAWSSKNICERNITFIHGFILIIKLN